MRTEYWSSWRRSVPTRWPHDVADMGRWVNQDDDQAVRTCKSTSDMQVVGPFDTGGLPSGYEVGTTNGSLDVRGSGDTENLTDGLIKA